MIRTQPFLLKELLKEAGIPSGRTTRGSYLTRGQVIGLLEAFRSLKQRVRSLEETKREQKG